MLYLKSFVHSTSFFTKFIKINVKGLQSHMKLQISPLKRPLSLHYCHIWSYLTPISFLCTHKHLAAI